MRQQDTLALLVGALGEKAARSYQPPRDRYDDMMAQGVEATAAADPALRRMQIQAIAGGDADITTAEEAD